MIALLLGALLAVAESAVMIQRNSYESTSCGGQVVRTEYMDTSCNQNRDGTYGKFTCIGDVVTFQAYNDSACTTTLSSNSSTPLSTCSENNDKYVSCADVTVVSINFYSTGCTSDALQGTYTLPLGCRATGGMENGQVRTMSQKVEMSGANLVSKTYSTSLDCTGTSVDVQLPCGSTCVNGSTSAALPDGYFAYTGSCSDGSLSGTSQVGAPVTEVRFFRFEGKLLKLVDIK